MEVFASNCKALSEPYIQLVSDIESDTRNGIIIYPNPVEDLLVIDLEPNLIKSGSTHFEVFQLNGQKVMKFEMNNNNSRSVNVSSLRPGMFILKLYLSDQIIEQKFIKE